MGRLHSASGLLLLLASAASAEESENSCSAREGSCREPAPAGRYYWPLQKGDVNRTGLSPYAAPFDAQKGPAWHWVDPHDDVTSASPLIDDELNIYIATRGGRIYKFGPDGTIIWIHRSKYGRIGTVPSLMDGRLFANAQSGHVFAVGMKSGDLVWATQVANQSGADTACLLATNGTVVSAADLSFSMQGNGAIFALDADGGHRWTFRLDPFQSFNFQASSPGDGTVVFQDSAGGVYRLKLDSGEVLWQSGIQDRKTDYFTTGAAVVGPNGIVYASSNDLTRGIIHAYRLHDGSLLWRRDLDLLANQAVAVGPLAGSSGRLAVVAGVGENPGFPPVHGMVCIAPPAIFLCLCLHACLGPRLRMALPMLPMLLCLLPVVGGIFPPHAHDLLSPLLVNTGKFCFLMVLYLQTLLRRQWWYKTPWRPVRLVVLAALCIASFWALTLAIHHFSLFCKGSPTWLWHSKPLPSRLVALDAETGADLWSFAPPDFGRLGCAGDEELYLTRRQNLQVDPVGDEICLPDSWSQAVIDGRGTVFVGFMDGHMYAVRDDNGDGVIAGTEAASVDFGHAFQGTQAIAPGMLAVLPCGGGLHVWRA